MEERLKRIIRDVPGFPRAGIVFKDITPILADPALFRETLEALGRLFKGGSVEKVLGIESRGFIFGPPLAVQLDAGFVPARKPGKLPRETIS
ncbi:MAG TPA: purine phosphoribosyltransferase family protein, partial [Candidatus Polarisedimenticolia bacterium]|nr:purine phosphoribosyltransferase family protein [Candidatus Polarisedimenticolia bacterium]